MRLQPPTNELPLEILIIDNGSTDKTIQRIQEFKSRKKATNIRIFEERRKGVSHARITGIMQSKYEALVFCDDDNLLASDYATIAWEVMQQHQDVALIGGNSFISRNLIIPDWFHEVAGQFAVQCIDFQGYLDSETNHWTAGLVARTKVLRALVESGFYPIGSTNLPGFSPSCGEDTEICLAVKHWRWKLYYDSRLCFEHAISPDRFNRAYLINQAKNFGAATIANDAIRLAKNKNDKKNWVRKQWLYQSVRSLINLTVTLPSAMRKPKTEGTVSPFWVHIGRLRAIWLNRKNYSAIVQRYSDWYSENQPKDHEKPWLPPSCKKEYESGNHQ